MKYLSEYRHPPLLRNLIGRIHATARSPYRIMEVCGGQTNTIVRYGLDQCLAPTISLLHGPGCPVCVTPAGYLDAAQELAGRPNLILCSFGDMVRVPGSRVTLLDIKAAGGDVRTLYSPLDAVTLAQQHPQKEIVFFGIGFETTAPLTALAILRAADLDLRNFSVLCSHVLIPPVIGSLLQSQDVRIDALLAPGHVCAVTGTREYEALQSRHGVPMVVTGFEPADILQGVMEAVQCLKDGQSKVVLQYSRAVNRDGNPRARRLIKRVFTVTDREWRGFGVIPASGLEIAPEFTAFDATRRFGLTLQSSAEQVAFCAEVLRGNLAPHECPKFGQECTPQGPLGAPMVSAEGACAAYANHARIHLPASRP